MSVCGGCRAEIYRWQDTKPSVLLGGGIRINSHAAYDDTPAGVAANRRRRWEDWRDLVVRQSNLIRDSCAREHRLGQGALFDIEVAA